MKRTLESLSTPFHKYSRVSNCGAGTRVDACAPAGNTCPYFRNCVLSLVIFLPHMALGQSAATHWVFESADVHVSAPGGAERGGFFTGGRVDLRGTTMLTLIAMAYGLDTDYVLGGPSWLNADRFDLIAKAPSPTPSAETMQAMLRALLADRFQLAAHHEQQDMPVYLLTVGKRSQKLHEAAKSDEPPGCPRVDGDAGLNHRACHNSKIAALIDLLPQVAGNYVDHPVVDRTGLTGSYDFQLDWMGKGPYLAAKANPDGPPAVSIFDAVEKLGLKLDPGTEATPVIVVDKVNRKPTENAPGVTSKIPIAATEFDAAEVRPSKPGAAQNTEHSQNGRLDLQGFTLKGLISMAFAVEDDAVVGGPKWLESDRFDVIAKAGTPAPDGMEGMLKTLIVQRFKLATHNDTQPLPVFALVLGKGSPKLKKSDGSARSDCKRGVALNGLTYACQNTSMAQLAERLPDVAGNYIIHPMVDLTGLRGAYDFSLTWTPKARLARVAGRGNDIGQPAGAVVQASTPDGDLTIFEAIDKQLGLKLEERKHPMPVMVIDHVERTPAEGR